VRLPTAASVFSTQDFTGENFTIGWNPGHNFC
jgi:hypothetical protein